MFGKGLIVIILLMAAIEVYLYRAFRTFIKSKIILFGCILSTIFVLSFLTYNFLHFDRKIGQTPIFMWSVGLFLLITIPRFVFLIFFGLEDFTRGIRWSYNKIKKRPINGDNFYPERRKFVYQIAMGIAAIPLLGLVHGMTLGKYNYKIIKQKLRMKRLPKAFNGLKILQITDIHSGSLDNKEKINGVIDLINQQEYDLLVFTGDIVNNFYWEMDEWIEVFKRIRKAPLGNYAILGNHDYGEYSDWQSEEAKQENFDKIKAIFPKIGFQLLLNEQITFEKDGEQITLIGVENWGKGFIQKGDLKRASENLSEDRFKILLSHDPSHWDLEVKNDPNWYDLTLSGHTHGTQMGIEVPSIGLKWSPAQFMYPQWAGFYEHNERIINVNRGFGYHFYPGRTGIWPEITVIELERESE